MHKLQHYSKIFPQKLFCGKIFLGENGGDRTKICATSNISGTEKIENLVTINVQKQLDLSRQICLSSFAKRKGTQNTPLLSTCTCKLYITMHMLIRLTIEMLCQSSIP